MKTNAKSDFVLHKNDCVFCREFNGSRETNFAKIYPEIKSRTIAETDGLKSFPCIGQIAPGHFLIAPKNHYLSFAETIDSMLNMAQQLVDLNAKAHQVIGSRPEDSFYFEHAAITDANGGCGIYHAHLHAVPNMKSIKLDIYIPDAEIDGVYETLVEALKAAPRGLPYAVYGSVIQKFTIARIKEPLPSQTLRRLVSNGVGTSAWDWRKAGREIKLLEMHERGELM